MIVVDTSALMAVVQNEADADRVSAALEYAGQMAISATTVAECLVVAAMRNVGPEMQRLHNELGFEVAPVTEAFAGRVARAYARWGKGVHPAGLNFGDCFAYALAEERSSPLLYVGDDFSHTNIVSALATI